MNLKQHRLSAAWPAMSNAELQLLANDIRDNGQRDPIVLLDGEVLDGWHRYQACGIAKVEPKFADFDGDDPASFVVSKNTHRRHLTAGQKAAAVLRVAEWRAKGNQSKSAPGADLKTKTTQQFAKSLHVSERTIEQTKAAIKAGPKVADAVSEGKISAKRGAEIAKLPAAKREAAIDHPEIVPRGTSKPNGSGKHAPPVIDLDKLQADLEESRENAAHLAEELEAANLAADPNAKAEILKLKEELRVVKLQRDDFMRQSADLKTEVKRLQRKLRS